MLKTCNFHVLVMLLCRQNLCNFSKPDRPLWMRCVMSVDVEPFRVRYTPRYLAEVLTLTLSLLSAARCLAGVSFGGGLIYKI